MNPADLYVNNQSVGYELILRLDQAALDVERINKANGWYESDRSFGDDIALLHSEVSEMLEAYRDNGTEDMTEPNSQICWDSTGSEHNKTICKHGLLAGECTFKLSKPEGVGSEAADVLVRLLDTCRRHDINLGQEFIRKLNYNVTRGHRHGGKRL